jgi:hypothetical protein
VAYLRVHGITCDPGMRQSTLLGAAWHTYRLGGSAEDITDVVGEIIASTPRVRDRQYLEGKGTQIISQMVRQIHRYSGDASAVVAAVQHDVHKRYHPALRRYAMILARAEHLRTPRGGQLDHGAIAQILGVDVRLITGIRGKIRDAGWITETGMGRERMYRWAA